MKKFLEGFKSYIFPTIDRQTKSELDMINIRNIFYVSMVVGVIQLVSLVVFLIINHGFSSSEVTGAVVRVGLSVLLCLCGFIISGRLKNNPETIGNSPVKVRLFVYGFILLLIVWSMFSSVNSYVNHQQMLTFYTVEFLAVIMVKLHPVYISSIIITSYAVHYFVLESFFFSGVINPYNYAMLAALSVVGAVLNYHLTVNYISEKNKANLLNKSLEIIANHDSTTRLQNRYALNQHIPDYLNTDICVAMGDINRFKSVNDTYGHKAGDDVLKAFADILLKFFPREAVFRYGGDEFLIVDIENDIEATREKLEKVNEAFSAVKLSGVNMKLSCSFGCFSTKPNTPSDFFSVLTQADKILYEEKEKTRTDIKPGQR